MPRVLVTSTSPSGVIHPFAGVNIPTGWLLCDGSAISRTTYPSLFAAIGVSHGSGDGSTTFNIPDYRGRFLRGVDHGTGRDPDSIGSTSATVTISIASPTVVTHTSHGYNDGDPVRFSTTGALPTGIAVGTTYYVIAKDANSYYIAPEVGGGGTASPGPSFGLYLATSGTQSGTHTVTNLSKRQAMNSGGNTGNAVGSIQSDQVRSHHHRTSTVLDVRNNVSFTGTGFNPIVNDNTGNRVLPFKTGGTETRPVNAYVNYIIKV